jgi:hypothetical protein
VQSIGPLSASYSNSKVIHFLMHSTYKIIQHDRPCVCSLYFQYTRRTFWLSFFRSLGLYPWLLVRLADVYMVRSAGQTHLISLRSSLRYPSLSFIPSLLLQHATRCPAHLEIAQMSKSISWMAIGMLTSPGRKNILTLRATYSTKAPSVHAT